MLKNFFPTLYLQNLGLNPKLNFSYYLVTTAFQFRIFYVSLFH